MMQDDNIYLQS